VAAVASEDPIGAIALGAVGVLGDVVGRAVVLLQFPATLGLALAPYGADAVGNAIDPQPERADAVGGLDDLAGLSQSCHWNSCFLRVPVGVGLSYQPRPPFSCAGLTINPTTKFYPMAILSSIGSWGFSSDCEKYCPILHDTS